MLIAMKVAPSEIVGDRSGTAGQAELDELRAPSDSDLGGNPVGLLQELCMKMKFPPPNYDVRFSNQFEIIFIQIVYIVKCLE